MGEKNTIITFGTLRTLMPRCPVARPDDTWEESWERFWESLDEHELKAFKGQELTTSYETRAAWIGFVGQRLEYKESLSLSSLEPRKLHKDLVAAVEAWEALQRLLLKHGVEIPVGMFIISHDEA